MALVESAKINLGTKMPPFKLQDPNGKTYESNMLFGEKGLLIAFTCNHCPYAIAVWPRLIRLSEYARSVGVETAAINPNLNPAYPEDSVPRMKDKIREWAIPFPYLVDETQDVARSFNAQCTPDLYLFDDTQKLVYHGRLDDNWKDENGVKREELKEAITQLANSQPISAQQHSSMGCSIKWRNG